jgi:hypothetical protein
MPITTILLPQIMVNNTNRNDIILDVLGRRWKALAAAKGELTPEMIKGIEADIRPIGVATAWSSPSGAESAIATATSDFRDYLAGERVKLPVASL